MTFWFHAFGSNLGSIGNTPISVVINGDESNIAASRTSDPEWREASVSLQGISGTYQVRIIEVTGAGVTSMTRDDDRPIDMPIAL